jgi:hypothetical protein
MFRSRNLLLALALGALLASGASASAPERPSVLPWIHDDYPKAVALAKARKVPIFVECWAPW